MACVVTIYSDSSVAYWSGALPTREEADKAKSLLLQDEGLQGIDHVVVSAERSPQCRHFAQAHQLVDALHYKLSAES